MSKENKGRYPWKNWATHETVDADGQVWQFSEMPVFNHEDQTWDLHNAATNLNADCDKVGRSHPPEDAYKTLIERYPKESSEQQLLYPVFDSRETKDGPIFRQPTPKKFEPGTDYIGRNDQPEQVIPRPILRPPEIPAIAPTSQPVPATTLKDALVEHFGRITERSEQHQDPEPAPETNYEETPFIPNKAEVWARFMAAIVSRQKAPFPPACGELADELLAEYEKRFLNQ